LPKLRARIGMVFSIRAFVSMPRGAMTSSVRPNRRALLYCSHHPASPTPNLDFAPPLVARPAPYCQPAAGPSLVLPGPASSARATKSVAQLAAFVRLIDTVLVQIPVLRPVPTAKPKTADRDRESADTRSR
jgi:hypothetical protein